MTKLLLPICVSLLLINTACSHGSDSPVSNTSTCTSEIEDLSAEVYSQGLEQESESQPQIHPDVFNPNTRGLIVKTKTKTLLPSGNPVREFSVKDIRIVTERLTEQSFSVELQNGQDASVVAQNILNSFDVEYIEPDYEIVAAQSSSNIASNQWAHEVIETYDAWKYSDGDRDIVVAVIDSGVDFDHPDLKAAEWTNPKETRNGKDDDRNGFVDDIHGWNYVERNNKPYPVKSTSGAYHGTHVAGIIAGRKNSSRKVSGVAPNVKLMALKFLNENKTGSTSNGIKSIYYAIDHGVKIINASWGSYNKSSALQEALRAAQKAGVLVVAASGNYGNNNDTKPFYPASYSYSNILSVTASTSSDKWLSGINYGRNSVDLAAPGSRILSTDRGNSYKSRSGSSMAAPFAAGSAALALSINSNLNYKDLKAILMSTGDRLSSLSTRVSSGRRVNLGSSVKAAYSANNSNGGLPSFNPGADFGDSGEESELCLD